MRFLIVIGSSHRVGSTWLYEMLRDLAHCSPGITYIPQEWNKFGALLLTPESYQFLNTLPGQHIFKTHSLPPVSETQARCAHFISIYRDPRDVLVSHSFYVAALPDHQGGEAYFRELTIQDRIKLLIQGRKANLLTELQQWFRTPYAYRLCYENLYQQPVEELLKIARALGLDLNRTRVERLVKQHRFEARSGRPPGIARDDLPMRKGIIGDWRNYFDYTCVSAFKTARNGQWNRLLVEMGYERHADWQ
jgi:hypothetical protein